MLRGIGIGLLLIEPPAVPAATVGALGQTSTARLSSDDFDGHLKRQIRPAYTVTRKNLQTGKR
jgi:hypothetical protein